MHVDDVGQRPQPVQQAAAGSGARSRSGNAHRNSTAIAGEDQVVDRCSRSAAASRSRRSRPSVTASRRVNTRATTVATTIVTLMVRARSVVRRSRTCDCPGLGLHDVDEAAQVVGGAGQPAVAEPRPDAALELVDGGADVVGDELDLVARRAGRRHSLERMAPTRPDRECRVWHTEAVVEADTRPHLLGTQEERRHGLHRQHQGGPRGRPRRRVGDAARDAPVRRGTSTASRRAPEARARRPATRTPRAPTASRPTGGEARGPRLDSVLSRCAARTPATRLDRHQPRALDRVVDGQRAAGGVDVEGLDHPAAVGDHA